MALPGAHRLFTISDRIGMVLAKGNGGRVFGYCVPSLWLRMIEA